MKNSRTLRVAALPLEMESTCQGAKPHGQDPRAWARDGAISGNTDAGLGSRAPGGREVLVIETLNWNTDYPVLPRDRGRGVPDRDHDNTDQPHEPAIMLVIRRSRCDGIYWLRIHMIPRDAAAEQAIHDNWICATVTYLDRETRKAWEQHRAALIDEKRAGYDQDGISYFLSPGWMWITARQLWHGTQPRGLEVTVDDLLGEPYPIWSSDFEDIRDIERSILFSVDAIAMAIDVGLSFSNGEEAVYAPGARAPRRHIRIETDDTPPDAWGG